MPRYIPRSDNTRLCNLNAAKRIVEPLKKGHCARGLAAGEHKAFVIPEK
jgi:hypothetical protein